MTRQFRQAFLQALESSGLALRAVAIGSGVSEERLKTLMQSETATIGVDDARKVAEFFGMGLDEFLDDPELSRPVEIAALYSRLPHQLKLEFQAYVEELTAAVDRSDQEGPEEPD